MPIDTEQRKCNQLYTALTGDNRRPWVKCGQCGGTGFVDDDTQSPPHKIVCGDFDNCEACQACEGRGYVWREDEKGRERIRDAILQSPPIRVDGEFLRPMEAWNNRHGQPWQESLEAAVHAYEWQAPRYDADGNGMLELMGLLYGYSIEALVNIADRLAWLPPEDWPQVSLNMAWQMVCGGE